MTFEAINGDEYTAVLPEKYRNLQHDHVALSERHEALTAAVSALADEFGAQGSHYHRDRVLSVLVATKEKS